MIRPALAAAITVAAVSVTNASARAVSFASSDGTTLAANLYEASARPAPAVLLVHMLGRNKDDWDAIANQLQESGITALAIDLRGHGRSGGSSGDLTAMTGDVRAAITWLETRPTTKPGMVAIVGASLGANLAALAAADTPAVRAIGLVSPSLDYRGVRLDASVFRRIGGRPVWMAASTQDPYALRTLKELAATDGAREQRLSGALAHGTNLLVADQDVARALVDGLRRQLVS